VHLMEAKTLTKGLAPLLGSESVVSECSGGAGLNKTPYRAVSQTIWRLSRGILLKTATKPYLEARTVLGVGKYNVVCL